MVRTPAGGPGAPEGGRCPGERAGRPASGSSSMLGGGCGGCRMADGASAADGNAGTEAQGCPEGGGTEGWTQRPHSHRAPLGQFLQCDGSHASRATLKYWGCDAVTQGGGWGSSQHPGSFGGPACPPAPGVLPGGSPWTRRTFGFHTTWNLHFLAPGTGADRSTPLSSVPGAQVRGSDVTFGGGQKG